ncbi:hypothetical protein EVJ50_07085 [Synechococcus sp. RSCCF101]|uniref:hypothetical protein n=1 Tax=Synechococcus sp. RSCCF101 TaxID=2511069 RepID=UPI001245734A|nr:hypothetical protein [Synechococcus sp. RSCCF101]QEY32038.1 hypothetical protein EVJ50_07085 [Synechococcus sp. RSCCF101]
MTFTNIDPITGYSSEHALETELAKTTPTNPSFVDGSSGLTTQGNTPSPAIGLNSTSSETSMASEGQHGEQPPEDHDAGVESPTTEKVLGSTNDRVRSYEESTVVDAGGKYIAGDEWLRVVDKPGNQASSLVLAHTGARVDIEGNQDSIILVHSLGDQAVDEKHAMLINGGDGSDVIVGWQGMRSSDWEQATPETVFSYEPNGDGINRTSDIINGGAGDDLIMTGGGSDLVDGGDGNDVIWINSMGKNSYEHGEEGKGDHHFDQNTLSGGEGSDTFVVSTFAQQMLSYDFSPGSFTEHHKKNDWTETFRDIGLKLGSKTPVIGGFIGAIGDISRAISGYTSPTYDQFDWTPPSLTIDIPAPEKSQIITDFNPLEDVLIVDLVPENDTRLKFEAKDPQQGFGFLVSQLDMATPLLDVTLNLDEVKDQLGNAYGPLSDGDLSEALLDSIHRSYLYLDGANDAVATGAELNTALATDLDWLGNNQMAAFGAVGTPLLQQYGQDDVNNLTGTNGNEVIAGFSTGSWRPEAPSNSDVGLYGFGGTTSSWAGAVTTSSTEATAMTPHFTTTI